MGTWKLVPEFQSRTGDCWGTILPGSGEKTGTITYSIVTHPGYVYLDGSTTPTAAVDLPSGMVVDSDFIWRVEGGFNGHTPDLSASLDFAIPLFAVTAHFEQPADNILDINDGAGDNGELHGTGMDFLGLAAAGDSTMSVEGHAIVSGSFGFNPAISGAFGEITGTYFIGGVWYTMTDETGTHLMHAPDDPGPPWVETTPPVPNTTHVEPVHGTIDGGTAVVITGTGFGEGATVFFDAGPATSVTVVNATQINATTPAGPGAPDGDGGPIFVRVRNIDGAIG